MAVNVKIGAVWGPIALTNNIIKRFLKAADIYKVIVENSRDGIAVIDNATGFFIDVNKAFCTITNKERRFLLSGKDVAGIITRPVPEADFELFRKVLKREEDLFVRYYHFQRHTGTVMYLKVKLSSLNKQSSLLTLEDITASSYSNKKWQESEKHFRHLFESSPVGLWEEDFSAAAAHLESLNLMGLTRAEAETFLEQHPDVIRQCSSLVKIVDVNQNVLDQYKVADKAYFLEHINELLFTEETAEAAKSFLAAICSNADADAFEVGGTTITGEKIYLQLKWNVTPGKGKHKYKRVILASIDITESKKTQRALEQASARLETIVDTIDGIVWTADPETFKLNFISKSVQDITGYPSDQFVGRDLYKFNFDFYADQKQMTRFRAKIKKGIPGTLEYPIRTKSGEEKWLQVNVSFIKEGDAIQLILGIVIDITMLKKSKNELNQSMEVLSEQNRRLLNFSYIVSHNLRSHSSNILSLCELIRQAKDAGEKEGLIRLLGEVAKLLHNTMEGLNEVVGIQASVAIPKEALNLRDYIDRCYYVLSDRIALKNVRFINNVAPSVMVQYNRAYLESVLQNIIANAIKYSHPGRVPEISLDFYNTGEEKLLAITDNGVGIDLEKNGKRLFGLFKNFTMDEKSRGIGLYIVKNQVEAMGGSVTVESKPGIGSCFKISFK